MTNEQKAARLEEMAANREADSRGLRGLHDLAKKLGLPELQKQKAVTIAMADADAALLRECAAMMRERGGISWTSEDRGHGMVLTSAVYRNRLIAIVGRSGRTFFWTVSKVAAREHEEFGTADTLEAARSAAIAWVDEQEGKDV